MKEIINSNESIATDLPKLSIAPNPITSFATINYVMHKRGHVILVLKDAMGQTLNTLVNQQQGAGKYTIPLTPTSYLASGIYFVQLILGKSKLCRESSCA